MKMKRRNFLKAVGAALFVPSVLVKADFVKTKPKEANSVIYNGPNYALYEGTWFYSDSSLIQFRNKNNKDFWNCMSISKDDTFVRWKHWKGKLYLYGKYNVWEILTNPVRVQRLGTGWSNDLSL